MAKSRQEKEQALATLVSGLKESKGVVFANFQGLKVKDSDTLRAKCREQNIEYVAMKKTLVKRALEDAGFAVDATQFEGAVAAIFGKDDEVAPAQIVANFAKDHNVVQIFGGVLEGNFIDAAKVNALSALPSKQQLLGQLVGTINAPVSGFVNVLAGNLRGLATVLSAIKDTKNA